MPLALAVPEFLIVADKVKLCPGAKVSSSTAGAITTKSGLGVSETVRIAASEQLLAVLVSFSTTLTQAP